MSNNEQYVAAIDIGTTKIVSIVGKKNPNGKIEILGLSKAPSNGVKRGVVLNIEETVSAIESTVADVQQRSGIVFTDVFVGIAGQHIKSMKSRGYINRDSIDDEIDKDDVFNLTQDMHKIPIEIGEEIIHVIPQNFIVDNETGVKNPIGMCGRRLEANFHIVIGQVASAKNIEKCIRKSGLKVKDLILEPLASSDAVLTDDEKEAGVVLVDIGGGTTDVAVYYDNIIRHTAVIPFGGNVVTRDIKEGCSILQRYAEQLKVQYGSALGDIAPEDKVVSVPGISGRDPKEISFKSLAYIIQSRMEEIIDAVNFEIQSSGYADKISAGVVITGGGAMLKHLPQLVRFKTAMDVRIGFPNEHLGGNSKDEINQPMFATSVGLIMRGLDYLETYKSNFNAGAKSEMSEEEEKALEEQKVEAETADPDDFDDKLSWTEKFKKSLSKMFETEDQSIN
ncbi:MAG: cell division protein FtsA [Bacteroidales bacterium]|jgi:cell division protein FtsA|nr:cell division protein FtsA [Bacteroidales bacterium]